MGGFLVKFLRKETWNVDTSGTLSKEDNVQIKINVFSSSDTAHSLTRSAVTPSPLEKAKNGRSQGGQRFLVNFLCKENWDIDTSGMLSKEGLLRLSLS